MRKLSILSMVVGITTAGLFLTNNDLTAQEIEGWFKAGSKPDSYDVGLDNSIAKTGNSSAFIASNQRKIAGFGTLMQTCEAKDYLGKKIKMTGYIKSSNVTDWAGMWLRIDGKQTRNPLSFDNMEDRPIKGDLEWTECEIILDVPEESETLNFGVLLKGTGKVWFDNISFEVVNRLETSTTKPNRPKRTNQKPTNLDFGE